MTDYKPGKESALALLSIIKQKYPEAELYKMPEGRVDLIVPSKFHIDKLNWKSATFVLIGIVSTLGD